MSACGFVRAVGASLAAIGVWLGPAACTSAAQDGTVVIRRVTIIDVARGRRLADQTVVMQGTRITAVGPHDSAAVPSGSRVVEGRERYLIPGLWDMHVHTVGAHGVAMLPVYVAYGVTGVRDMGADLGILRPARARIASGAMVGPRIVMAGPILDGPLGAPMPAEHRRWRIEVTDTVAARRLVDSIAAAGADFIKVHERLAAPVYHAIADQARQRGLGIAGHAPASLGPAAASAAGQRSIEHLVNVPIPCTAREAEELQARSGFEALFGRCSREDPAPLMQGFAERGTWHTPTLVVQARLALGAGATPGDPGLRHVPASVRATLSEVMPIDAPRPPDDVRLRLQRLIRKRIEQVGALHRAGVGLLVGSDAPAVAPGWSVHEEMRLFVDAGMSTLEALRAATRAPAMFLGAADSLGTIAPGFAADLVLLEADPLADIRNTTRIAAVIANGRLLDRAALDALLADAERRANDR